MPPMTERNSPNVADRERMGSVKVRWSVILPPIQVVRKGASGLAVGHPFSVRVRDEEVQTCVRMLLNLDLHGVIARVVAVADFVQALRQAELLVVEAAEVPIVAGTVRCAVRIESGLVYVRIDVQMPAHIPDVGNLSRELRTELML